MVEKSTISSYFHFVLSIPRRSGIVVRSGILVMLFSIGAFSAFSQQTITEPTITTTQNYEVPAGVTSLTVECWGGGGGGGGATNTENVTGGGGGGGGYTKTTITVTPGAEYLVTVGAGGPGAAGTNAAVGGTGGTSSFAALASAIGGAGGSTNNGTTTRNGPGGLGANIIGGTNNDGGNGGTGDADSEDGNNSGGGGGGAGTAGDGGPGGAPTAGNGGAGGGGDGAPGRTSSGDGIDATELGGGGGGARRGGSSGARTGGDGFRGQVIISYTLPDAPTALDLAADDDKGALDNDNLTNQLSNLSISGSSNNNATIQLFDDGSEIVGATIVANGSGAWGPIDITLSEGAHDITATATIGGNTGAASAPLTITVDDTPPILGITLDGATPTNNDALAFSLVFDEEIDDATLDATDDIVIDVNSTAVINTPHVDGDLAEAIANLDYTFTVNGVVNDGSLGIVVGPAVTDLAGNPMATSKASAFYTVDNTPPAFSTVEVSPNTGTAKITDLITITATTNPVEIGLNPGAATVNGQAQTIINNGDGTYKVDYTVGSGHGDWAAGALTFSIELSDAAGNATTVMAFTDANTLAGDATPPAAPSTPDLHADDDSGLNNADNVTNITIQTISGTAENGATVELLDDGTPIGGATVVADGSGDWSLDLNLGEGEYDITARATDVAGNTGPESAPLHLIVDTSAPLAPGTPDLTNGTDAGVSNSDNITNDLTPTFTGSGEEDATIEIFSNVDAGVLGSAVVASGTYTVNATLTTQGNGQIHQITARATDVAGNVSPVSGALSITLDATAPTIVGAPGLTLVGGGGNEDLVEFTINEPASLTNGAAVTFSPNDGSGVGVQINSNDSEIATAVYNSTLQKVTITSADANSKWAETDKLSYIAGGNLFDIAGNQFTMTAAFLVNGDATPPTLSPDVMTLYPRGNNTEKIVFTMSEDIKLTEGAAVTGFSISPILGAFTATFSGEGTTNTVTLESAGNGIFSALTTVSYSGGNLLDMNDNPLGNFILHPVVTETEPPSITSVTIPNSPMKVGQVVTATINVADDEGDNVTLMSGSIGGFPLFNIVNSSSTQKTAQFQITQGGTDVPAGNNIPVANLVLRDGQNNNSAAFNGNVNANANDAIDANSPTVTSITNIVDPIFEGAPEQTVTVVFSEAMNTAVAPVINITNPGNYGGQATGSWSNGNKTYTTTFLHNANAEPNTSATTSIAVGAAQDAAGNVTTNALVSSAFVVDNVKPVVNSVVASTTTFINPNYVVNIGSNQLTIQVVYNEAMNASVDPDIAINIGTGADNFTAGTGSWSGGNTIYTIVYTHDGTVQESAVNTVEVSNGEDARGNVQSGSATSSSFRIDTKRPTVNSINIAGTSPTNATSVAYTVEFSEAVTNIDNSDFKPVLVSTASGTPSPGVVSGVSTSDNITFTVTVNSVVGDGVIRLDVDPGTATISDALGGNALTAGKTGDQTYTIDQTVPLAQTIDISTPTETWSSANGTSSGTLTWLVTFSEDVTGVDAADFDMNIDVPNTIITFTPGLVITGSGNTRTVTLNGVKRLSPGGTALTGQLFIDLINDNSIKDAAGNSLGAPLFSGVAYPGSSAPGFNDYYTPLLAEPDDPATSFAVTTSTTTSITFQWAHAVAPDFPPTHYVVQLKKSTVGSFPEPQDGIYPANVLDSDFTDGTLSTLLGNTLTSHTFFGLTSGFNYDIRIISTAYSGLFNAQQHLDYLTGNPLVGTGATTVASATTIASTSTASSIGSLVNTSDGAPVYTFSIDDDGANDVLDNAPTKFTSLTVFRGNADANDWTSAIAGAQLTNSANGQVVNGTVGADNITFTGIPSSATSDFGYVQDNLSKAYTLRIWLTSPLSLTDNTQLIFKVDNSSFTYDNTTDGVNASQASSTLAPAQSIESNPVKIDVQATNLVFITNPQPQIGVQTNFSQSSQAEPVVHALDANGNLDTDYGASVTVGADIGFVNGHPNFISGVLTLSTFRFTQAGSTTIRITGNSVAGPIPYPQLNGPGNESESSSVTAVISNKTTITEETAPASELASFSSITNSAPTDFNFDFTVTDDVGVDVTDFTDNDGLPTSILSIEIRRGDDNGDNGGGADASTFDDWTKSILGATLQAVGSAQTVSATITGGSLQFAIPGGSFMSEVPNDGSRTYQLRIWLQNPVDPSLRDILDNKDFVFEVNEGDLGLGAANTTSTMTSSSANSGDGRNAVIVTATQLDFINQWAIGAIQNYDAPLDADAGTGGAQSPSAKARDANGNLDTDFGDGVTVEAFDANTGDSKTYPLANDLVSVGNGLITFEPTLRVTSAGDGGHNDDTHLILESGGGLSGNSNSFKLNYSAASDILKENTFVYPTNMLYAAADNQVADITPTTGIAVERFKVRDGGGAADADGTPTKMSSVTVRVTNYQYLRRLALYEVGTSPGFADNIELVELDATDAANIIGNTADFTFTGIAGFEAPDNGSMENNFEVRVSFTDANVTDNEIVTFEVIAVQAEGVSSAFATPAPTGVVSTATGNENKIEVVATQIDFMTVPATASLNVSFAVVVHARDANANLDADYNGAVSFTGNGNTEEYTVINAPTGAFTGGVLSYPVDNIGTPAIDEGFQFTSGTEKTQLTINGGAGNTSGESVDAGAIAGISPPPGIEVKTSFDSWLYFDPAFSYTTRIPFVSMQETSLTNTTNSVELAGLILSDGGAPGSTVSAGNLSPGSKNPGVQHDDVDGASTRIDALTISLTNFADIRKIALFDDAGNKVTPDLDVLASTVTFTGLGGVLSLTAPDNGVSRFYIRASFQETVGADLDQISIQIVDVVWHSGSQFPASDATTTVGGIDGNGTGGDSSDPAQNIVDVVATSLDFVTQPSAFAGINQPIDGTTGGSTGIVHARDKFENLDTEFNFAVTISADAIPVSYPATFTAGVLDLAPMQYQAAGEGTLVVLSNGLDSSVPGGENIGNSIPCDRVDVIHVTAVEDQSNGVIVIPSLKGGTTNQRIFGVRFVPEHTTAAEPSLHSFSITFRNENGEPQPYTTGSAASEIFTDFKIHQSIDNTITLLTDPDDISITEAQSVELANTGAASTHLDKLIITFVNEVPLYDGREYTYYLAVNINTSVTVNTPKITPYVLDLGYGTDSNDHMVITQGSTTASVAGIERNFASTKPPVLVSTFPENGTLNVDPGLDVLELHFDLPVVTFDGTIDLYNRETGTKVATLTAINGLYQDGTPISSQTVNPLKFQVPAGFDFKQDSVYYVTIAKGVFSNINAADRAGIADEGLNLFGGITYNGTFYFKASSPNPPILLGTDLNKYFFTPSTATFNLSFNQAGSAHYMVVDPAGAPATVTNDQIRGITPYTDGIVIARDSVVINQLSPNLQFATINASLALGVDYPVYVYAKNDAQPVPIKTAGPYGNEANDFAVNADGPTLTITKDVVSRYSFPRYEVCSGSVARLEEPLIIAELSNGEFSATVPPGSVQSFNLLLPSGFQFDISKAPTVEFSGADFGTLPPQEVAHAFVNTTLLQIKFVNTGATSFDNIVITDLFVVASTNDLSGFIKRFSGSGLTIVPELQDLARITSIPADPISFTNSYDIANDFHTLYPIIDDEKTVTYIPDNYLENGQSTVKLIPEAPLGDYGASFFSGSGLSDDILNLTAVTKNAAFNITLTHTDQNGCVSTAAEQYAVYDHTNAIPELLTAPGDIRVCVSDENFPGTPSSMLVTSDSVSFAGLAGYRMISLHADIPKSAENSNQIIGYGSEWHKLVKHLPVLYDEYDADGSTYRTYNWDYSVLMNNDSLTKYALANPYQSNFSEPTPLGQTYYTGGSLGTVEFTGLYQSTADFALIVPYRQQVQVFVPAIPLIEVAGQKADKTLIFCENGASILMNGYPAAAAGASTGTFILRDSASNAIIAFDNSEFIDNGNGTATLFPGALSNGYQPILVEYIYKDNNSPCENTARAYIQISPNPVASFEATSVTGSDEAPFATSFCENNPILFDGSISSFFGVEPKLFEWEFGDIASATNEVDIDTASVIHTFMTSTRYNVSLTVTSIHNCVSAEAVQPIDVGAIPVVSFSLTGVSTADPIDFTDIVTIPSSSAITDGVASVEWEYGDGTGDAAGTNAYAAPGKYDVNLTITSQRGCVSDATRQIVIVPQVTLANAGAAYQADFEGNDGGFQTLARSGSTSSWAHGLPSGNVINDPDQTNHVWTTGLSSAFNPEEKSGLYTACFDIEDLTRPILTFNRFVSVGTGDGVVIEYSIDNLNVVDENKEWITLGSITNSLASGVEWYNGVSLPTKPGQDETGFGWTGNETVWKESKHSLSEIASADRAKVVFRFSFASAVSNPGGADPKLDGFAIDDFRVGNGTRTVLLENFSNTSAVSAIGHNNEFRDFQESSTGNEIVKIDYHVAFPGDDPFNDDNPADPGARALYYGVSAVPHARLDGSSAPSTPAPPFAEWVPNEFDKRILELAKANMVIGTPTLTDGVLSFQVRFTPLIDIPQRTILQVAIVEETVAVAANPSLTGRVAEEESEFKYVLKKLLPNAAGTPFQELVADQEEVRDFTYTNASLFMPENDIAIIVFLQDEMSKNIYQSEILRGVGDPGIVTGIEDLNRYFNVYPNPADREMIVELPLRSTKQAHLKLYDAMGKVVHQTLFEPGETRESIETNELTAGVYLIQVETDKGILTRKVMVVHRN